MTLSTRPSASVQASLKRKWEEVSEDRTEAVKTQVRVDLDVKDQEDLAKTDAKTQVKLCFTAYCNVGMELWKQLPMVPAPCLGTQN